MISGKSAGLKGIIYMKVAIVHDYLNQSGGAERVLDVFCEMFPDAPIYTLIADEKVFLPIIVYTVKSFFFWSFESSEIMGSNILEFPPELYLRSIITFL